MYDVPSYVDRRFREAELAEQELQFEPSFGWVGRTERLVLEDSDLEYQDYNQQADYDRISYDAGRFQPRFSPPERIHRFGFDESQNDVGAVEGFGDDDLFLDPRQTRDRTSNDYGDVAGNILLSGVVISNSSRSV